MDNGFNMNIIERIKAFIDEIVQYIREHYILR